MSEPAPSPPLPPSALAQACLLAWAQHPQPHVLLDAQGRLLALNPAAAAAWGDSVHALLGQRLDCLCGESAGSWTAASLLAAWSDTTPWAMSLPNGAEWSLEVCYPVALGEPLTADAGQALVLAWRALDGQTLEAQLHQRVLDSLHDGVLLCDEHGRFLAANRAAEQVLGWSQAELRARSGSDPAWRRYRLDGTELPPAERPIALALASQAPVPPMTLGLDAGDGSRRWLRVHATRVERSGPGQRLGVVATFADVTAQVETLQALRESEQQFRLIADHSQDVIWIGLPRSERLIFVSRAYERLWGRPVAEALSQPGSWRAGIHPDDSLRVSQEIPVAAQRGQGLHHTEFRVLRPDGRCIWVRNRSYAVRGPDGRVSHLVGIAEDITDSHLAAEQLRQRQEAELALSRLVAMAPGVLLSYRRGPAGQVSLHIPNPEVLKDFGMRRPDGSFDDIRRLVLPSDRERLRLAFVASAQHLRPLREEFRVQHPARGEVWVEMHVTPVCEPDGVIAWHGFLHDISAHKHMEAEIRRVNTELEARVSERTAELEARNKAMEAFTYSVSHDLKAPLRGIDGYSRLLLTDHAASLNEEGRFFLDSIRKATVHMGRLIDDLLAYSRVERSRPTLGLIDPVDVLTRIVSGLQSEMDQGQVQLTTELQCHAAMGEREGLTMAVRNLLDNALKFTQGRSPRQIELRCVVHEGHCLIEVRDNGPGFDMRYHDRIFEIFQRLHRAEDYPGTGVGLAIVRKAVERMRGRVWATSTLGQGACFSIELPLPR